jgi:nitrite reductase/ring-hydroxylating ferredoxin subunit
VGDASVLTAGRPARATAEELDVVLVAGDDKLGALLNGSSHCGSLHRGAVLGDCIVCPRHGTRFGLDDGSLRHGPGAYPQPSLQVRVRGGRVEVRAPRA